jgi:hypothetical protein
MLTVERFDGAISVRRLPHPDRLFNLEVTFDDEHPHMLKLREQKPPVHFHYSQVEYIEVVEGSLYIDLGEKQVLLTASDGEYTIPPWTKHRAIPGPLETGRKYTKFILSGPKSNDTYMLDFIFYENYYRYMDQVLAPGAEGISIIQILCVRTPVQMMFFYVS